jgi:hypothetical protein
MKLSDFGIEIYGAIDGYSRFIPWIYVGITARTSTSVGYQLLDVLAQRRYHPKHIRVDLRTEHSIMGDIFLALYRLHSLDTTLEDIFWTGKSTQNQRIESF